MTLEIRESTPSVERTAGAHRVGSLAELRSGKPMRATVDGQKVALFLVEGDVVATNGRCPHAQGPLHEGEIEGVVLTCPWHGWTFNLRTGFCEEDPSLVLEIFESEVVGDDILVKL
jgi:nitrite reductase (NADH) small subunit